MPWGGKSAGFPTADAKAARPSGTMIRFVNTNILALNSSYKNERFIYSPQNILLLKGRENNWISPNVDV
jgi:hypothetical protein